MISLIALPDITVIGRRIRINGHIGDITCPNILSQISGVVPAASRPGTDGPRQVDSCLGKGIDSESRAVV